MSAHVLYTPYTKVEETFQVNNIYDHLYLGLNKADYDFQEFPGVVDRTFISSLLVAVGCIPFKILLQVLGFGNCFYMLYVSKIKVVSLIGRIVLGTMVLISLKSIRVALEKTLGSTLVSKCFIAVRNYS